MARMEDPTFTTPVHYEIAIYELWQKDVELQILEI